MAIVSTDIVSRLSGGASNTDPNAAIGGAESSTAIVDASLSNLFSQVTSAEATAGSTKYRCYYVHNAHATLTMQNAQVYIATNTPSTSTDVSIGLGAAAIGSTETAVANETTAPASVTFSQPGSGSPLTIGDIPAGSKKAVWVKRIVSPGAAAYNADNVVLTVTCDTAA